MREEVLELRRTLLANGYTPLPNVGKVTFLKDWAKVVVNGPTVARWGRHRRWQDTGLRIQDGLAVIDLDINHQVIDVIAARLEKEEPALARALVRYGKGKKEAWFVRTGEPFGRIATRRWLAPGADLDRDGTHVVEIFGGASPRQFGAFGAHTRDAEGGVEIAYEWADASPADRPLDQLPTVDKTAFFRIVDTVEEGLEAAGWQPVIRTKKGESAAERVYDLTPELMFECNDGLVRTLAKLEQAAGEGGLRCSASWLEPGRQHSITRCLIGVSHSGGLTLWDSATGVTHMPAKDQPLTVEGQELLTSEELHRLGEKLAPLSRIVATSFLKPRPEDTLAEVAAKLIETYAWMPTRTHAPIAPIGSLRPTDGMTLPNFRTTMLPFAEIVPAGSKTKRLNPVTLWESSAERKTVAGLVLRPGRPWPIFEDNGQLWLNSYRRPTHEAPVEGVNVFEDFVAHLLPDIQEREWFLNWLAFKFHHPEVPGPGVLMVCKRQGAGRGTLFAIVKQLLGQDYVHKVDPATLTGDGNQSQYNTWLANSVVLLVDELFNAGAAAFLWQRKRAYDRVKALIDPTEREVEIIQKTFNNYTTITCASFLMASNNLNALPLTEDDRRISVLSNGEPLAKNRSLAQRLNSYRRGGSFTPGFVAGVAALLTKRDISSYDPYGPPPLFLGKLNMIENNITPVAEAADQVLMELVGDYVTRDDFIERVRAKVGSVDDGAKKGLIPEARDRIEQSTWFYLRRTRIHGDSKAEVWARDKTAAAVWEATPVSDRSKLLAKNAAASDLANSLRGLSALRSKRSFPGGKLV